MTDQSENWTSKHIEILHFNDVYDIEENKPKPGATAEEESVQIKAGAS